MGKRPQGTSRRPKASTQGPSELDRATSARRERFRREFHERLRANAKSAYKEIYKGRLGLVEFLSGGISDASAQQYRDHFFTHLASWCGTFQELLTEFSAKGPNSLLQMAVTNRPGIDWVQAELQKTFSHDEERRACVREWVSIACDNHPAWPDWRAPGWLKEKAPLNGKSEVCPKCGSTAIVRRGPITRCNQCALEWGGPTGTEAKGQRGASLQRPLEEHRLDAHSTVEVLMVITANVSRRLGKAQDEALSYARERMASERAPAYASGKPIATDPDSSPSTTGEPDTPIYEAVLYIGRKIGEASENWSKDDPGNNSTFLHSVLRGEIRDVQQCSPKTRDLIRQMALSGDITVWGEQQLSNGTSESTWRFDSCLTKIPADYWIDNKLTAVATTSPLNANVPYTLPVRRDASQPKGWENSYADLHVNWQQVVQCCATTAVITPKPKASDLSHLQHPSNISSRSKPDVNRRRFIVAQHRDTQADGLCSLFDNSSPPIPLTPRMKEAGGWIKAYRIPRYRHAVDSLISRDRKKVGF